MMSRPSGNITMSVGGQVVGEIQSLKLDSVSMMRDGSYGIRGYALPKTEGTITMEKAEINMEALAELFGKQEPSFDIEVTGWRKVRPFPNGRTRLPKKKRIRNKWIKRYYRKVITTYRDCHMTDDSPVPNAFPFGWLTL